MTTVLVDTHAALWLLTGQVPLGPAANAAIDDPAARVPLSAVVVWEVSIERRLGKLESPDGFADHLLGAGLVELPVSIRHARRVEHLPDHHRDPFDRLIVAQAQLEGASIVTRDPAFTAYDVATIW